MKKLLAFVIFLITLIPGLAQTVSDGEYFIQVNTTKKYIAIEGISQDNGAKLVQWDFVNSPNHKFIIKNIGNNLYIIKAVHSGKYLSLEGVLGQQGAKIIQWDWVNQDNQKWFISPTSKSPGSFAINTAAGLKRIRLTGNYGNPANGAYFVLNDEEPANYFTFKKNEVESPGKIFKTETKTTTASANTAKQILADVQDGIYKIRINESGKYLAIAGEEDNNNGMRLIQWDMLPRNNHLFDIRKLDNGNYSISPVHSQKVLDVVDMKNEDGTQIQQWDNLNGNNQQWKFYNAKNGLSIISVASGKSLQLSAGTSNNANGTHLIISGSGAQTFTLLPARANKYTEVVTLRNLKFAVPHGGDLEMFGNISVYLVNKQGNSYARYYLSKSNSFFSRHEKNGIDMDKQRIVNLGGELKFQISNDELPGASILIIYGINENDADVASLFTQFGSAKDFYIDPNQAIPVDKESYYAGGSDDFYHLKNSFNDCLKSKISSYGHFHNQQSFYVTDIPGSCNVHVNLQDEDGSDNWLDIYFTVSKERKY